jgi:phosphate transport system permease protein
MTLLDSKISLWRSGEPFVWITGGALAVALLMVIGLIALILVNGLGFFWPTAVERLTLADGRTVLGQVMDREVIPRPGAPRDGPPACRIKIKQGNRDVLGADFVWIDEAQIVRRETPTEAAVFERLEWGNFYGVPMKLLDGNRTVSEGHEAVWAAILARLPETTVVIRQIHRTERGVVASLNREQERIRLVLRRLELRGVREGPDVDRCRRDADALQARFREQEESLKQLRGRLTERVAVAFGGDRAAEIPLAQIVRVYRPNAMGFPARVAHYLAKLWEFVSDDPRESNTEGGVFPALFGTVLLVLIMSVAVTPLGVIAAVYLREYAKQGKLVSVVRIAVNNLAGVPSIVFGVFGVGFFIYGVGGSIDRLFFAEALPTPTFGTGGILWASLTLALLTVPVVIVATEEGLAAVPLSVREGSLALAATKFETTWRVVLPAVMPSILTGLILAVARAAGEVAPLMITGVVKLAPALPLDGFAPYAHLERKFMHLGFHIYDVGFQSPNVDAARPMVFATTLLLLLIVVALNMTAILLRKRLRRKYAISAV